MNRSEKAAVIEAIKAKASTASFAVVTDFKYGARDIIRNGHNGIITPQGDTAAFARALSRMAGDERLRAEYGANASASAVRFGKEKIMEEWKKKFLEGW